MQNNSQFVGPIFDETYKKNNKKINHLLIRTNIQKIYNISPKLELMNNNNKASHRQRNKIKLIERILISKLMKRTFKKVIN